MAEYLNTITLGGVTLHILSSNPKKTPKKRKSIIGKRLVETNIIGINAQQWTIVLNGIIVGATIGTDRAAIEALDDVSSYALVDGIHDGNYVIIPGTLVFNDSGNDAGMIYKYSMTIVEW